MAESPKVVVLGASGYAGALSAALVQRHPEFELVAITSRNEAGSRLDAIYPHYRVGLEMVEIEALEGQDFDAAIVAYPHMAAAPVVKALWDSQIRVIDLSADFRIRQLATYEEWYGPHPVPELISQAIYGLPELYRSEIAGARLVANPGCYPTATILALHPLARAGLIADLVVDAKSGVSGAGRAATDATHFVSVDENVTPYKVPRHRHTPEIEQELAAAGSPVTMTFTPHLLPLDQGELVSCYATLTDPGVSEIELRAIYHDAYSGEHWIELSDALPGVRDVRDTNYCRISVHKDPRTGRAVIFAAIDNLWKGTASQAIQNLNLMFGYDENLGAHMTDSFFTSRWVAVPENAVEVHDGVLPKGFRAAGVAAGIKASGDRDVALIVSDEAATTSAARFSRSGAQSAPVLLNRERADLHAIRAVVVNSGNANAATGGRGLDDAAKMQGAASIVAGVRETFVAVASTGVIGVPLPMNKVTSGIAKCSRELRSDGAEDFAEAIRTTDAFEKSVTLDIALSAGTVRLAVQAKGAGMISPNFATLLVFVQTDAALDVEEIDLLLSVCTKRSFDRISVDGQLSTSDTIIFQASGASGVQLLPESADEQIFGEALDAALRQTALLVAKDGEGARRVGRVVVRGGEDQAVLAVAHAVADSPLVKTALYGADPNWGRIIQAVGAAMPGTAPLKVDISIEGIQVCRAGAMARYDEDALKQAVQGPEIEYEIQLPGEGAETERYFSDLGHEYVTINADYTT